MILFELRYWLPEYLLSKKQKRQEDTKLTLDWVGGLKKYKEKYSSLELEKKA